MGRNPVSMLLSGARREYMLQVVRRCRVLELAVLWTLLACGTAPVLAQQKPKIAASSLTLPVFNPLVWNIMKARGFDAKHGFELEAKPYPSISAFYAAFATGETDTLIGGPTILQKLYQEGVPLRIFGTAFTLADLLIFAKDANIKSLADLKGKQLAADMGGSQFQVIKMYANAKGIELGKDITVVNANFAVARAQLEADRVEAALEDVANVILHETDAADKIAADTVKLPPGILKAAVESKRLNMIVEPAWEPAMRKSIWDMMERAVQAGFYQKLPDDKIIYAP